MDKKNISNIIFENEELLGNLNDTNEQNILIDEVVTEDVELSDMINAETTLFGEVCEENEKMLGSIELSTSSTISSYNELKDKPSINNVTLIGNKSLKELGIPDEEIIPIPNSELENLLK